MSPILESNEEKAVRPRESPLIWPVSLALGAVVLSVYTKTLCPTVPGGDSGELIQVAIDGGVVHPPGYPTWTMMANAFAKLPLGGEPAWRVNLSSAVCGALAVVLLSAGVGKWVDCAWTGVAAGGAYAFAPLVWTYAVQGEVFALNNLNNALLLFLLVRYEQSPSVGRACAGAFAIGLAICNQHTLVFFCAPYACWALGVGRAFLFTPRALTLLALSGLVGLSPYIYLPLAGGLNAAWGSWGDLSTWGGFLTHVLRREYGTFKLANIPQTTDSEYVVRLTCYLTSVPGELPPLGAPLVLLGALGSTTAELRRALAAFGRTSDGGGSGGGDARPAATGTAWTPPGGRVPVLRPDLQLPLRICPPHPTSTCRSSSASGRRPTSSVPCGTRSASGTLCACSRRRRRRRCRRSRPCCRVAGCYPSRYPRRLSLVAAHASNHHDAADMSRVTIFRDFGIAALGAVPDKRKVVVLTLGDEVLNALRYAQRQLGHRRNVTLLDLNYMQFEWFVERAKASADYEGINFPGTNYGSSPGAFYMDALLGANYDRGWLFFVVGGMHASDPTWQAEYRLWPLGMAMQVLRRTVTIKLDKWTSKSAKLLPRLEWHAPPAKGSWEEVIARNHYLNAYHQRPFYVLNYAYEALKEHEQLAATGSHGAQAEAARERARERFLIAAKLYELGDVPLNGSQKRADFYYRNMGVAYSQLISLEHSEDSRAGAKQKAALAFLKYLAYDSLSEEDRTTVERGVVSLIPPPHGVQLPPGADPYGAHQRRQQQQQQQQAPQQQPLPAASRPQAKNSGGKAKRRKKA